MTHDEPCAAWEIDRETSLTMDVPDSILSKSGSVLQVRQLDESHAKIVDDNWKFRDPDSYAWILDQCKNGFGFGVFVQSEKDPVSWIISYK